MKSTTIISLAIIFFRKLNGLSHEYISKLLEVLLMLIKEKNKETFKAVLAFLKLLARQAPRQLLLKQLKGILLAVFEWDPEGRDSSRGIIRNLMKILQKKIVRKYFYEGLWRVGKKYSRRA